MSSREKLSNVILSRRSFAAVGGAGIASFLLAACGSETSSTSSESSSVGATTSTDLAPAALPDGMGTSAKDGEFPRTVKHFRGETTLETKPSKIVVLSTGQLDDILALGIVPAASATANDADLVPAYLAEKYSDQKSALDSMATVGTRKAPDIEAIASLKPDLILINNTNKDDSLYESLKAISPTVVTEGTGVNWKQDFLLIAAGLGTTDKANSLLSDYNTKVADLSEKASDSDTFSFLYAQSDRNRVFAASSFVGSIAADAKLARPESQQVEKTSVDISAEQLDQADASWIFYGVQGEDDAALKSEALWETLSAVQNNHAVKVDSDMFFLNAGITAALGVIEDIQSAL